MKKVFLALTLLVLASLACSLGNASPSAPPPAAASAPSTNPTVEPAPATPADSAPTAVPSAAPSAAPAAGLCAHLYYPVKPGASWQYQLSGPSSGTFTRSIVSLNENGFEVQDVFSAGTTLRASWACQQGSLIRLTPSGSASVSFADVQMNFVVESNNGVTLPADLKPGAAWTQHLVVTGQNNIGGANVDSRMVMDLSCKAIGVETVSVPAGSFDALRVDCSTRLETSFAGTTISVNDTTSAWYAPGVGEIKARGSSEMGSSEFVLLSYSIP
jgi:hypothetical protein